jgi:hypothetical protein
MRLCRQEAPNASKKSPHRIKIQRFILLAILLAIGMFNTMFTLETEREDLSAASVAKVNSANSTSRNSTLEQRYFHARISNITVKTDRSVESIPPSKMKRHYHHRWNHTTSTVDLPKEYLNPFGFLVVDENGNTRRPLTSLEILQRVMHGTEYKAQFEALDAYMNSNGTTPIPKCLVPDVKATRELAKWVVDERNTMRRQAAEKT